MANDDDIIASSDGDSDEKAKQQKESALSQDAEWKTLTGDKFKSEKELAEAYKALETKLGQTSDEVRKTREFAEIVNPLLEEIRNDPEIFNKLDEKLRKRGQPNQQPADAKTVDQTEMRTVASDLVLARFEEKHGIDKLSADEKKNLRQSIGDVIYDLTGTTFDKVDLRRLGGILENAYVLANKDKLIEKSKLEALVSAQGLEDGSISSIPSSQGKGETTLTPEEAKIADRLGLTREQYLEGKTKLAKK